jgi:hypothetical protein
MVPTSPGRLKAMFSNQEDNQLIIADIQTPDSVD